MKHDSRGLDHRAAYRVRAHKATPTASASTSAAADAGFSAPPGQLDGKFTGLPVSQASVVDESGQTVFQVHLHLLAGAPLGRFGTPTE